MKWENSKNQWYASIRGCLPHTSGSNESQSLSIPSTGRWVENYCTFILLSLFILDNFSFRRPTMKLLLVVKTVGVTDSIPEGEGEGGESARILSAGKL